MSAIEEARTLGEKLSLRLGFEIGERAFLLSPILLGKTALSRRLFADDGFSRVIGDPYRSFFWELVNSRTFNEEPKLLDLLPPIAIRNSANIKPRWWKDEPDTYDQLLDDFDRELRTFAEKNEDLTYHESTEILRQILWLTGQIFDCGKLDFLTKASDLLARAIMIYGGLTPGDHRTN